VPPHGRVRGIDRDLIRGGHYGQRSYEPHTKAEHMAAPTKAAPLQKSPCQRGAVHTWHLFPFDALRHGRSTPIADRPAHGEK
jgi:hypothetical protein